MITETDYRYIKIAAYHPAFALYSVCNAVTELLRDDLRLYKPTIVIKIQRTEVE